MVLVWIHVLRLYHPKHKVQLSKEISVGIRAPKLIFFSGTGLALTPVLHLWHQKFKELFSRETSVGINVLKLNIFIGTGPASIAVLPL